MVMVPVSGVLLLYCIGLCYGVLPGYDQVRLHYDIAKGGCIMSMKGDIQQETAGNFKYELAEESRVLYCCRCSYTGQTGNIPCNRYNNDYENKEYPEKCPTYKELLIPGINDVDGK